MRREAASTGFEAGGGMMRRERPGRLWTLGGAACLVLLGACGDDTSGGGTDVAADVSADVTVDTTPDTAPDAVPDTTGPPDAVPDEGGGDVPPAEGAFGAPCGSNAECDSGWCVEGPNGFVCTKTCELSCPGGYDCKGISSGGADVVFLCLPRYVQLCTPCATDTQCKGGACLTIDGEGQCGYACEEDADCPEGYGCLAAPGGALEGTWCQPKSGSCSCTPDFDGGQRTCSNANTLGTCYGVETCDPAVGWGACSARVPTDEVCNGQDDDCNGLVDDGLPTGEACVNEVEGVGACAGVSVCFGPQGWVCQAATPEVESCDFKDNDCDGEVDEDFRTGDVYGGFEHCGTCNASCANGFPNADVTSCQVLGTSAQCIVETCQQGFVKLNEFQCVPNVASICQPCSVDANCFGEGAGCIAVGTGNFCSKACAGPDDCPSGYACEEAGKATTMCVPVTDSCSCDGTNTDLSRACNVTYTPTDAGQPAYTCTGLEQCTVSGWGGCTLPGETCDGVDNDCDGQTDETFKNANGKYFGVQNCGGCGISCLALAYPNAAPSCNTAPPVPQCTFACQPGWFDVNGAVEDGCECKPVAGPDLAGDGQDTNCDGIDGDVAEGVFVAKNGTDSGPGTLETPMLTVDAAVQKALDTGKRDVYVATGVYSESVTLRGGVGVFGGYSSDFALRNPTLFETAIIGQAPTASKPGAVSAISVGAAGAPEPTVLAGFTIFGANAANQASANSYAVYVRNSGPMLQITGNRIFAGAGGNGSLGLGGSDGNDGVGGAPGGPAYDMSTRTCTAANEKAGGAGGKLTCGGVTDVSGGNGGAGKCPQAWTTSPSQPPPPLPQENGQNGLGTGGGAGGKAGYDNLHITGPGPNASCSTCYTDATKPQDATFGLAGAKGSLGAAGQGCAAGAGSIQAGHWAGTKGGNGGNGVHGGGGGGGGAGGGVDVSGTNCVTEFSGDDIGGQGGGGGSGGCGGLGGTGGGAGGGSFGVFVVFDAAPTAVPVIEANGIRAGSGGAGGSGGPGGAGGLGGDGAPGGLAGAGTTTMWCAAGGANGGDGGQGGHGGGGGGGCGGAAYAIYVGLAGGNAALVQPYKAANTFLTGGQGGSGGSGGPSLGQSGTAGATGTSANTNF